MNYKDENLKLSSLKSFKEYLKPIEVIEPYKPEIVTFDSVDEFNLYYNRHPEEFANMTTQKLNMKYKIPGYRITQTKGSSEQLPTRNEGSKQLKLIKDYYRNNVTDSQRENSNFVARVRDDNSSKLPDELINRIEYLEKQVEHINNFLSQ